MEPPSGSPARPWRCRENAHRRLAIGSLPVIYPFIVDDPGEAAPAKRRLSGITIGHMTPAVAAAELSDDMAVIRELVEEYSSAQILDPRRAGLVAREIVDRAESPAFRRMSASTSTPPSTRH